MRSFLIILFLSLLVGCPAGFGRADDRQTNCLVKQLVSKSFQEREAAAQALERIGKPALKPLREAASDKDPELRRRAQTLLHSISLRVRIDALIGQLASSKQEDSKTAAAELQNLGDAALQPLRKAASGDNATIRRQCEQLLRTWEYDQLVLDINRAKGRIEVDEAQPAKPVIGVSLRQGAWGKDSFGLGRRIDTFVGRLDQFPELRWLSVGKSSFSDAGMSQIVKLKKLQDLDIYVTDVTDDGLKYLKALPDLRRLSLYCTGIGDAGLKQLARISSLESLDLTATKISDQGLAQLSGLTKLTFLCLYHTSITDAGLRQLKTHKNLELLILDDSGVTDEGLRHLRGLSKLQTLKLNRCKITDRGLEEIGHLTSLTRLELDDTMTTDAGLACLKGLTNLKLLSLNRTSIADQEPSITDQGLEHLKGLKHLQRLSLFGTKVTSEGEEAFRKAVPGVKLRPLNSID